MDAAGQSVPPPEVVERLPLPPRAACLTDDMLAAAGPRAEQERLLWSHVYPLVYAVLCEEALEDVADLRDRLLKLPWRRMLEAMTNKVPCGAVAPRSRGALRAYLPLVVAGSTADTGLRRLGRQLWRAGGRAGRSE